MEGWLPFINPPSALLLIWPFGWMSYPTAFFAWTGLQVALFAVAIRSILPGYAPVLAALALPAVFVCVALGQIGLLLAALMAGFLSRLESQPVRAGVLLGLLTIKPQFGLLWPLLLLAGGHFRAFAAAAVTAVSLAMFAVLSFGPGIWASFVEASAVQSRLLAMADLVPLRLQSAYGMSLALTHDTAIAVTLHAVLAAAVAALVLRAWWQPEVPFDIRAALGIAGGFLVSPYGLVYDAAALAVAAAFIVRHGLSRGFRRGDAALLLLAAALPALGAVEGDLRVAFLAWLMTFAVALRHAGNPRSSPGVASVPAPIFDRLIGRDASMAKPGEPKTAPHASRESRKREDPAPVVVAGPEAQRREQPERKYEEDVPTGDKAPVVVTGPEAQARERPAKKD